jgi:hypothetical protein
MRFLARLLGSTSDPALRHLDTLPVVVARLAAAQQETNDTLGKALGVMGEIVGVMREIDAGLSEIRDGQRNPPREWIESEDRANANADRAHVDSVTTNALLGKIERALEVIASPPAGIVTPAEARAKMYPPPVFVGGDEIAAAFLAEKARDRVEGHGGDSLAAAAAQQPGPEAAPEAPAATDAEEDTAGWCSTCGAHSGESCRGPLHGYCKRSSAPAGTELPPPPASEEPATSLPGKGTQARKVYEALVAIAEEGGDWPGQAAVARRVGLPSNVIGGNIGQLRRIGAIIFVPSDGTPDIKIAATGKIVRRSAPPAAPAPTAEVVPIRPAPPAAAHVDAKPVIPDGPRAYLPPSDRVDAMHALKARGHKVIPMSGGRFFHNGETIDGAELVRRANEAGAA